MVEADSVPDEAVAGLPVDSVVGVATLVGLEVEVAMPDQHRQRNLDKDWAA